MRKFVEILWMAIAAVSLVELVISYRSVGFNSDTKVYAIVAAVAGFMFFFRRRQRSKLEARNKDLG
jgi:hypothetical protein